jgi:hypothetical protein
MPLIFIIDLDGTIIGDITPQIMLYDVAKALKTVHVNGSCKFDTNAFRQKLKNGIIRPHFESFVKTLINNVPNVEFFIYTASEKTWAEFVIKNIEQCIGVKFNRPIFSRSYCLNENRQYKKSLQFIYPSLIKALKKKYGILLSKKDLSSNTLIIDNNTVYQQDHKQVIICPTYNYRVPENIPCNISHKVYNLHHQVINSVLKKYININASNDYLAFEKEFYMYYIAFLGMIMKHNTRYVNDKFWMHLKDIIITQKIEDFTERNYKMIHYLLKQRNMIGMEVEPSTLVNLKKSTTHVPILTKRASTSFF